MIDDELAVIGSANCNRRGYEHDSEVNAFVFDDAIPIGPGGLTFAQGLRMNR
jgi:phosphatidylserine/phosphatidylglycerophosphate/cardiolipin synthase-like enzyme